MSGPARASRIVRCPACERYYRMTGAPPPGTRLRCTKCGEVFTLSGRAEPAPPAPDAPEGGGTRVLLATDGPEFHSVIGEVLRAEGHTLRPARTGEEAWTVLESWGPQVALLDVGIPGLPAYEICDRVRAHRKLAGTGLILIASVFQHTRYKRSPTSLYGADDYIERHHIRDALPAKIRRLLPPAPPPPAPPPLPVPGRIEAPEARGLVREERYGTSAAGARESVGRLRENLKRYARIIVSDIALYNEDLVERGIREGSFYSLLKKELEEGRRLYLARVPPAASVPDHFAEAVREFIDRRSGRKGGEGGTD